MEVKYLYRNGQPVPQGYCVKPDHYVTTLSITLRSLTPIQVDALRDLIQQRHEVIGMVQGETVCVVANTPHPE